jgi:uncharacterized protein (TIGR03067 family)
MRLGIVALGAALVLLGAAGSALAQKSTAADTERQKLQGTWALVSGEADGKAVPEADVRRSRLTFEGNKISVDLPQQSSKTMDENLTKLDPTKNPREMIWVRTTGPNAGKPIVGIYEFQGADQFRICFDPSGRSTPKELTATAGSGHVCNTWKRAKP